MNNRLQSAVALAVIGLCAAAVTHSANACGLDSFQNPATNRWSLPAYQPSTALTSDARTAVSETSGLGIRNPLQRLEPITGLYHFTMIAAINAGPFHKGDVVDTGFVTWHADGTELMNSGRPAYSSNFCMGVWEQTGRHSYKLNHYALAWDMVNGQTFTGVANIREYIKLADNGQSYHGAYTLDQYNAAGTAILLHEEGPLKATRITPDSH